MTYMMNYLRRHREMLLVTLAGLLITAALNYMMTLWHTDSWTNPKVGFWAAFYNRYEISGFDPYTYITISKWRPLYVLSRHPLLAAMMWPLSELNLWLKTATGMNCTIYIVAVLWTMMSTWAWALMYRIVRILQGLSWQHSLLLTLFFFSFSHIMLTIFVPDHMSLSLPLILLAVYLGGKAAMHGKPMPLWQSMPLTLVATGVTTTNIVKVGLADLFSRLPQRFSGKWLGHTALHFMVYLLPMAILFGAYQYQEETTQKEEYERNEKQMAKKSARDSVFAQEWKDQKAQVKKKKEAQTVKLSIASNTEYHIGRWASVQENIFGEGLILHPGDSYGVDTSGTVIRPTKRCNFVLKDANRNRPTLVRYSHWWYYAMEAVIVALFLWGMWCGRRERLMQMTTAIFLVDMLLHVGLNFASADVYIMTAHWAFVIPVAIGYLLKSLNPRGYIYTAVVAALLFLTLFMWWHNAGIIYQFIVHSA